MSIPQPCKKKVNKSRYICAYKEDTRRESKDRFTQR